MTENEYIEAQNELRLLVQSQTHLFKEVIPRASNGESLAEAYWGFIEKFAELKKAKVR